MKASNRLILNTAAQYTRTIINVVLSLYSSRLILQILGESDFGIYTLVAGIVSLLSFFTDSLSTSTQRFLSVSQGEGLLENTKKVFTNSIFVHIAIGFVTVLILLSITPFLFDIINIPSDRHYAALIVYYLVIGMIFVSLLIAPYRAVLISQENIVYTSIIDVIDGILKLVLIFLLSFCTLDKLILYAWIMLGIRLFDFLAFSLFSHYKYEECIIPRFSLFDSCYVRKLMSFTGWSMYSSACIMGRAQLVAIIINRALGTVANAAYGIGSSLLGYVCFLSSAFNSAVAPQLMKACGAKEVGRMFYLAFFQCKLSFILFALLAIPSSFEIDTMLRLWLGNVPRYANIFSVMFMLTMQADLMTSGLGTLCNAKGRIAKYSISVFTPKLAVVPLSWLCFHFVLPVWSLVFVFLITEIVSMLIRIPSCYNLMKFDIKAFFTDTVLKALIPVLAGAIVCFIICQFMNKTILRFFITYALSSLTILSITYLYSLTVDEKNKIKQILFGIKLKITNLHE